MSDWRSKLWREVQSEGECPYMLCLSNEEDHLYCTVHDGPDVVCVLRGYAYGWHVTSGVMRDLGPCSLSQALRCGVQVYLSDKGS